MTNTKEYSGRVSRVGPDYAVESVGFQFMIEGSSQVYRVDIKFGNYHLGLTKIGDIISFKYKGYSDCFHQPINPNA